MKSFWWFKDNAVAGMARPGFNSVHWLSLPFAETLVFGWLGQRSCGSEPLESFHTHIKDYGFKIRKFHRVDEDSFKKICIDLENPEKILEVFEKVEERTKCLEDFQIKEDQITFKLSRFQLESEIEFLKMNRIHSIVNLTEKYHQQDELNRHFKTHHIPIADLEAPREEQVLNLTGLLKEAQVQDRRVAIHCMAGIGRTSTMILAAHVLLGESLNSLCDELNKRNPHFILTEPQSEFIRSISLRAEGDI